MTYALEGVRTREAPMTPDHSVMWEQHEVAAGMLFVAPSATPEVIANVLRFAITGNLGFSSEYLGSGANGEVRADGGVAYKKAHKYMADEDFGLSCLQANVALSHGLKTIDQSSATDTTVRRRPYEILGPEYLAGLLPRSNDEGTGRVASQIFAMSRIDGMPAPKYADLPTALSRRNRYIKALMQCGLDPDLVELDDGLQDTEYGNLLIGSDSGPHKLFLFKTDAMAAWGTAQYYPQ